MDRINEDERHLLSFIWGLIKPQRSCCVTTCVSKPWTHLCFFPVYFLGYWAGNNYKVTGELLSKCWFPWVCGTGHLSTSSALVSCIFCVRKGAVWNLSLCGVYSHCPYHPILKSLNMQDPACFWRWLPRPSSSCQGILGSSGIRSSPKPNLELPRKWCCH